MSAATPEVVLPETLTIKELGIFRYARRIAPITEFALWL